MRLVAFYFFVFLLAVLVFAPPNPYGMDGESLFQSKCAQCHSPKGEAPVLAPVKYAAVQWDRFFTKQKHNRKKNIDNFFSPEELQLIKSFLISHAADSDRPIAAGLR